MKRRGAEREVHEGAGTRLCPLLNSPSLPMKGTGRPRKTKVVVKAKNNGLWLQEGKKKHTNTHSTNPGPHTVLRT